MSITSSLIILFLPWAIRKIYSFFSHSRRPTLPHRPRTLSDHLITVLLLSILIYNCYKITYPPPNIFSLLSLGYDAPSYLVRNNLRDYFSTHQSAWRPSSPDFDMDAITHRKLNPDDINNSYDHLVYLYETLKSQEARKVYALYGEQTLMQCSYCRQEWDYYLFYLPHMLSQYAVILLVTGFSTMWPRKMDWRWTSTLTIVLTLAVELSIYYAGSENVAPIFPESVSPYFLFDTMTTLRSTVFVLLSLAILMMDTKIYKPPTDTMSEIIENMRVIYTMQKAVQLTGRVVMADAGMKKLMMEKCRLGDGAGENVDEDKEVKKAKEKAMRNLKMEDLLETSKEFINQIEGYLGNGAVNGAAVSEH